MNSVRGHLMDDSTVLHEKKSYRNDPKFSDTQVLLEQSVTNNVDPIS